MNAPTDSASLPGQLNQLEQANLIRLASAVPELEYLFRHALIQESVYQTLVRADRRRVHRAAGQALEALLGGRPAPAELAPILARHFEEAGDHARALHYYTLAADAALAGYANAEAVGLYTRALAAAERSSAGAERSSADAERAATAAPPAAGVWQHLFEARGRAFELDSHYAQALANYQAMRQRAEMLGDRHLALAGAVAAGQIYATANELLDLPRAEQMAADALTEARTLGDEATEAKVLWNQLNLYRFTERYRLARASGEQSLEIARRLKLDAQAASTVNDLIHVYAALGAWPEFERTAAEAGRRWQALGNSAMLADSLSTTALYLGMTGQFAAALAHGLEAYRLTVAIGNRWGQAYSLMTMVWPYWYTGQPQRAIDSARECIRAGLEAWSFAAETVGGWLGVLYGELGDPAGGLALIDQVAEANQSLSDLLLLGSLAARVYLELRAAGPAPATADVAARLETLYREKRQPRLWEVDIFLRVQSSVALAQGNAERALDVTQAQAAQLRQRGLVTYVPEALARLAQALLLAGRAAEARDQLAEALAQARAMGAVMVEWEALYALGRLEREQGDPAGAEQHWAAAREIVAAIAARVPTAALRRSFLGRPELRALLGDSALLALAREAP